jgi:tetratricopeptide (TPR) repeat protein
MGFDPIRRGVSCLLFTWLVILAVPGPSRGQPGGVWIGARVVLKHQVELGIGDRGVSAKDVHAVYTVERVNGGWLGVVAGGMHAWVPASEVVPYDQAIDYYTSEIQTRADASWAYNQRGFIRDEKGQFDAALADFDAAIRIDPTFPRAYNNRGLAWAHKNQFDKALADYDEALRLNPSDALPLVNRARAWSMKKEYDKAIADLDQAIRIDPKYFNAHNGRGWLLATCPEESFRNGTEAVKSATRACELEGWNNAYCLGTLAAAHAEAGDFEQAIHWQQKANRLYTDDPNRAKGRDRLALYRDKTPFRMPR